MNAPITNLKDALKIKDAIKMPPLDPGSGTERVKKIFSWVNRCLIAAAILFLLYWLFASDRYVSTAVIVTQNTDQVGTSGMDLGALMAAGNGPTLAIADQLLLKEHLLSVDMLKKLDDALDLRSHYSDSSHDIASRMWFKDISIEWFYRHFLSRVNVEFDEYTGVLRINTQAYTAKMANAITSMLVNEGERYMNELSHQLAREQVRFLENQVEFARRSVKEARDALVAFQNNKGMVSPKATVDSMHGIIANLEAQRTQLQTQIAALPKNLDRNHAMRKTLNQSLAAVEQQIKTEKAKLASGSGKTLNSLMEEQARLEEEVTLKQDVYKNALICLEKGRMDAARTLKIVSVLQAPSKPEYAWEPRRIYGVFSTICVTLLLLGIINLLKSVVLDHVD